MSARIKKIIMGLLPAGLADGLRRLKPKIRPFFRSLYITVSFYLFDKVPPPEGIVIDPSNICNLKCPLCPTGAGKLNYPKMLMAFETFKTVIDKMPFLKSIALFNWGEPFLNPEIFQMIKYAKVRKIKVSIHTNFSFKKEDKFFADIVNSGLDLLSVSLDGASKETYSKYRIGGDFDLAVANIKKLVAIKRQLNSKTPEILWKMVVNRFNENEIEEAREMAGSLGVRFVTAAMHLGDVCPDVAFEDAIEERKASWLPKDSKCIRPFYRGVYRKPLEDKLCQRPFTTLVVNPDGKIFPCCEVADENSVMGDLLRESFHELWSNNKYKYARCLFSKKKYRGPKADVVCAVCDNFRKQGG